MKNQIKKNRERDRRFGDRNHHPIVCIMGEYLPYRKEEKTEKVH